MIELMMFFLKSYIVLQNNLYTAFDMDYVAAESM